MSHSIARRIRSHCAAIALMVAFSSHAWGAPPQFDPPELVGSGAGKHRLNRHGSGSLAFDATGTLHLVWWEGGFATLASQPSFVYYSQRGPSSPWIPAELVDAASISGSDRIGGRQPSMVLDDSGAATIVWHDHRHSSGLLGWIDNIEIYAIRRLPAGGFSPEIRLTTTASGNGGDNGYSPRIAARPGASGPWPLSVAWYDFHFNGGVSDLFVATSDASGLFDPAATMASRRLTDATQRGNTPAFTMVDIGVDADGNRHLVWMTGSTSGGPIYYARAPQGQAAFDVGPILVSTGQADFQDPPRIAVNPASGEVIILTSDASAGASSDLWLYRLPPSGLVFDAPAMIAANGRQWGGSGIHDPATGDLHVVWVDERSGRRPWYGRLPAGSASITDDGPVVADGRNWARPTLALGPQGRMALAIEDDIDSTSGAVYVALTPAPPTAANPHWALFE